MERGGFHGHTNTSAKFFINDAGMRLSESHQPDCITLAATNSSEVECRVREQDRFMPIANVIRIMRRILPAHAKISDDAKESIQECVSEYISFITGEANERCQREHRKTITAEDVLWAMNKLGFDDYIEPLTLYLQRYRELEGEGGGSCGGGVMSMGGSLVVKRANGISNEYGGYGPKLHVAQSNYSHGLNKQNQNK